MSRTVRLSGYSRGKPVYSQKSWFGWYRKEYSNVRIEWRRKYRRECKNAVERGEDIPVFSHTQGWISK